LISICIPAFQRVSYLERLLESILLQTETDIEVVVTDDSPDESVQVLVSRYLDRLPLRYYKNPRALGTPENWNEGMRRASGAWIKIMHDDDWLEGRDSMKIFAQAIRDNPGADFIFSAYQNVAELTGENRPVRLTALGRRLLKRSPWYLLGENYIGNPSCTLFRKKEDLLFDPSFKWVVDFEFYIRYLKGFPRLVYLDKVLVNIGINPTQVTNYTFGVARVQIPENHLLLERNGNRHLLNLVVYDYFWRLYRNLGARSEEQIREAGYDRPLHPVLASMIRWQSRIPPFLLRAGVSSKSLMFMHYLTHFYRI